MREGRQGRRSVGSMLIMMRRQPGCRIFMPNEFELAVAALQRDGVIAYATEAVFGLGCDPDLSRRYTVCWRSSNARWRRD